MQRRVLVALRPVSPIERLFSVAAALSKRMDAELEIVVDPAHPALAEITSRFVTLRRSVCCYLKTMPGLDVRSLVDYARSQQSVVSVVVGRPAAWDETRAARAWAKLECPLVAACNHASIAEEEA